MPDTSPLSPGRKLVAMSVLVALFAASMGAAQLVMNHKQVVVASNHASVTFALDPALKLITQADPGTEGVLLVLATADEHRDGVVYAEKIGANRQLEEMALEIFQAETGREPTGVKEFTFRGYTGVELRDVRRATHDFAIMRVVETGDQMVGILWQGDTTLSPADQDILGRLMNGFTIKKGE